MEPGFSESETFDELILRAKNTPFLPRTTRKMPNQQPAELLEATVQAALRNVVDPLTRQLEHLAIQVSVFFCTRPVCTGTNVRFKSVCTPKC